MQLLHELMLLFKAIGKRLVMPTCKVDLFPCHIEYFFNPKPNLGYRFEVKIDELRSKGLLSNCEEQNLGLRCQKNLVLLKKLKQRHP